jgi:homogentisate 1,2-dioxygenase
MIGPGEVAVVQRGIKWKVGLPDGTARGCKCFFVPSVTMCSYLSFM